MVEDIAILLVWLGFFASVSLGWYFYLKARNRERLALIEKNADVSEIFKVREIRFRFPWLKIGMIITGAGFGVCLALFSTLFPTMKQFIRETNGMVPIALMMFFGGVAIIVAYYLEKPKDR